MLKKILAGVLALVMVLSFAACSEKKENSSKKDQETTATTDQWNSEVVIATTAPYETEEPTVEATEPAVENGFSIGTNLTAVIACFNNIGPGMEAVGPMCNFGIFSPLSKVMLSIAMLAGRLEIFPILVLLSRSTWKR